jgi:tripartite-type tricarboxylate transporter receptor subunit TctC
MFATAPAVMPLIKGNRIRPLGVASNARSVFLPDVPTMKEAGVDGVEVTVWYGVLAPAATPKAMVAALSAAIAKAAHDPEMKKRLAEQGAEPVGNTSEEFSRILRDELARWAEVVKVSGARAE